MKSVQKYLTFQMSKLSHSIDTIIVTQEEESSLCDPGFRRRAVDMLVGLN